MSKKKKNKNPINGPIKDPKGEAPDVKRKLASFTKEELLGMTRGQRIQVPIRTEEDLKIAGEISELEVLDREVLCDCPAAIAGWLRDIRVHMLGYVDKDNQILSVVKIHVPGTTLSRADVSESLMENILKDFELSFVTRASTLEFAETYYESNCNASSTAFRVGVASDVVCRKQREKLDAILEEIKVA